MSYLSSLRLHFSGQFQADTSTVNNDPQHFDAGHFRSNYQLRENASGDNGWWNPRGTGAWRFANCQVTRVAYRDGTHCDDPNLDVAIGAAITDTESQAPGRLVDLDPHQQGVSEIWGFQVLLRPAAAGGGAAPLGFTSDFKPAPFADIWKRFAAGAGDTAFSAMYQSVLTNLAWAGAGGSRFLRELMGAGQPPARLSIKFTVDGFDMDVNSPTFAFGRVCGTIGPAAADEPAHVVVGRALSPTPNSPLGALAYARLEGRRLLLDLGNSLPAQTAGGPAADQDRLCAALLPAAGEPIVLAEIPYREDGFCERTAGIFVAELTAEHAKLAARTPLGVVQSSAGGMTPFLAEDPGGRWVRADEFVFRLNPGEEAQTRIYAATFGQPAAKMKISLGYDPTQLGPPPPNPIGEPRKALTFPVAVTTGADGTAVVTLTATDPGNPRGYIDGQVYGVAYGAGDTPPAPGATGQSSQMLNALVWSGYQAPKRPSWLHDVLPIFQQYANLYPVMLPLFDLANYASVMSRRRAMQGAFATRVHEPDYMPVTRDLSEPKRAMIRRWLADPVYLRLDSLEDLRLALQQAVELEHATLPPYLCALYSIKPGANPGVAEAIRSVAVEEMLHLALVSNLMISLGLSPRIGHPRFVPRYPGGLPGGLHAGLTVRLRRCSLEQIRDVFLAIEEPEQAREPVKGDVSPASPREPHELTIGWFYDEIELALRRLAKAGKIAFGHAGRQVSEWRGPGRLIVIRSLEDAIDALHEIKDQGEGASPIDPDDGDGELAHYYRFAEIVEGRRLVKKDGGFAYTGEKIPFDPAGVWPMIDDPDLADYPPGSRAAVLAAQFARTYQALLNGLHRTFNGEPAHLRQTIGQMFALDLAARELMQTPSGRGDGTTAGPTFQLPASV